MWKRETYHRDTDSYGEKQKGIYINPKLQNHSLPVRQSSSLMTASHHSDCNHAFAFFALMRSTLLLDSFLHFTGTVGRVPGLCENSACRSLPMVEVALIYLLYLFSDGMLGIHDVTDMCRQFFLAVGIFFAFLLHKIKIPLETQMTIRLHCIRLL